MIPILQQMFLSEYSFGKPGSSSFSSTIPIKRNWSGGKCTDLTFQLIGDGGGRRRCAPAAAPGLAAAEGRGGGGRRSEEKVVGLRVGVLVVESEGRGGGGHGGEGRGEGGSCGLWPVVAEEDKGPACNLDRDLAKNLPGLAITWLLPKSTHNATAWLGVLSLHVGAAIPAWLGEWFAERGEDRRRRRCLPDTRGEAIDEVMCGDSRKLYFSSILLFSTTFYYSVDLTWSYHALEE